MGNVHACSIDFLPGTSFAHLSCFGGVISVEHQRLAPRIVLHVAWSPTNTYCT